jgi:hypothetical protein
VTSFFRVTITALPIYPCSPSLFFHLGILYLFAVHTLHTFKTIVIIIIITRSLYARACTVHVHARACTCIVCTVRRLGVYTFKIQSLIRDELSVHAIPLINIDLIEHRHCGNVQLRSGELDVMVIAVM